MININIISHLVLDARLFIAFSRTFRALSPVLKTIELNAPEYSNSSQGAPASTTFPPAITIT